MTNGNPPPPFVVGQTYCDREGEYTVVLIEEDRITIERPDGRRATADAALKARIHRNVITERDAVAESSRVRPGRKRREPTKRRQELIEKILQLEADGANHSGVEIDRILAG